VRKRFVARVKSAASVVPRFRSVLAIASTSGRLGKEVLIDGLDLSRVTHDERVETELGEENVGGRRVHVRAKRLLTAAFSHVVNLGF